MLRDEWLGGDITRFNDRGLQLTTEPGAEASVALVFDPASLAELNRYRFDGTASGVCFDGERFITSDGSANLQHRSTNDFTVESTVAVVQDGVPVTGLSALECSSLDAVFALVSRQNRVVVINPASGLIIETIDLANPSLDSAATAIAIDRANNILYATGKGWAEISTQPLPG